MTTKPCSAAIPRARLRHAGPSAARAASTRLRRISEALDALQQAIPANAAMDAERFAHLWKFTPVKTTLRRWNWS